MAACKLPTGPRSVHISKSQGADTNIMKFYITQNSTTYGARYDKFQPRPGQHRGTGYLSSFRPGVYYSSRLDKLDNPAMGRICEGNYRSITQMDFQPYTSATGVESFPGSAHQAPTGFIRQKPLTIPGQNTVKGVFIDTRAASAPASLLPRHTPLLHTLKPKDPVEAENCGYGPSYMKTETQQKFQGKPWPNVCKPTVDLSVSELGPGSLSGFTHNDMLNDRPDIITSQHKQPFDNSKPGWYTQRPTGVSVFKTSYNPTQWARGDEALPGAVARGSERGTGFTHEEVKPKYVVKNGQAYDKLSDIPEMRADRTQRKDPMEYLNMQFPHNKNSVTGAQFTGQQRPAQTLAGKLDRTSVGFKEETGFVENHPRFVQTADDKTRFLTHYNMRLGVDPTPVGSERQGHVRGGVQGQKADGFTKSTNVNNFGSEPNSSCVLRAVEPYVGRSIAARVKQC